jgi:hypothetical protein
MMGVVLTAASRFSAALQRQVHLRRVIEIGSDDGIVYHFTFKDRRVSFRRGEAESPTFSVRFSTSDQGFRVLTARDRFALMKDGFFNGSIRVRGDVAQFLWFEALTRSVSPGRVPAVLLPSRYVTPSSTDGPARWIVREPEATALDPTWTGAVAQRDKLVIMRVPAGKPLESAE